MSVTLGLAYGIALIATLWLTAISVGTDHDLRDVEVGRQRPGLFARLVLLDAVVVPLVVLALIEVLGVAVPYAQGLLIVGAAAAGPLGLKATHLARGDVPLAIGLVVILELLNIVTLPIWAAVLFPEGGALPLAEIVRTLALGILLPLLIGFAIRARFPDAAGVAARRTAQASSIALAALMVIVIVRDGPEFAAALGSGVPMVAVMTVLTAMVLGWLAGGPDPDSRRTGAFVSSVRANVPALAVATTAFGAASPAVSAIVVFGLCSVVLVPVTALLVGRRGVAYDAIGAGSSPSRSAPTS